MTIKGSCCVEGDKILVTISKKPSKMTWDEVETMLRGFIEG
jgi:hypothetical protein